MSQADIIFLRKRINQMLAVIILVGLCIVFFEAAGYAGKASKNELNELRTEFWGMINKQTTVLGNYVDGNDACRDSLWGELHRLQDSINILSPYQPEPTRGGSSKKKDPNKLHTISLLH